MLSAGSSSVKALSTSMARSTVRIESMLISRTPRPSLCVFSVSLYFITLLLLRHDGLENLLDDLMAVVLLVVFLTLEIERFEDRQVVGREKERVLGIRSVHMLMPRPRRNHEEVAFLPVEAHAVHNGVTLSLV